MGIKLNEKFMQLAVQEARKNLKQMDGGPFGACIVKNNKVLAIARNTVIKCDATAHAEINAIRAASKQLNSFDLSGCIIYSTTEPCPMCFSAIHWARIDFIIYGTAIGDVRRLGFHELSISSGKMKKIGKSKVKIFSGFLVNECVRLLKDWHNLKHKVLY